MLLALAAGALGYVDYVYQAFPNPPQADYLSDLLTFRADASAGPERREERTFSTAGVAISTGVMRITPGKEPIAPLKIRTSPGNNYFIKLFNIADDQEELAMYIEGGRTLTTEVPLGTYKIRYASGDVWYGERYRFGPDTVYYETDKQFTFRRQGSSVNGYTVELILRLHGNLRTRRIDPAQF